MELYKLADNFRELADKLEEMDIDKQVMLDTLEGSTELMSFEQKAEGIVCMIKNWESDLPGLKAAKKQLAAKEKAIENRISSAKSYLKSCMEKTGFKKIKIGIFTSKIQTNSKGTVIIENPDLIPAAYIDIIPEQYIPNKDRLYQDLKTGKEIPGVRYEVGNHLRIG